MVGFFEDETHFGDDPGTAPGPLSGPVLCGGRCDATDQLGRDHSGSKFGNEIIEQIEQGTQKTDGRIGIHITIEDNVIC